MACEYPLVGRKGTLRLIVSYVKWIQRRQSLDKEAFTQTYGARREVQILFNFAHPGDGWPVDERTRTAIDLASDTAWRPATCADADLYEDAEVIDLAGLPRASGYGEPLPNWPADVGRFTNTASG